ncbi:MAG: endonuclease [Bacteroidota bacterium]
MKAQLICLAFSLLFLPQILLSQVVIPAYTFLELDSLLVGQEDTLVLKLFNPWEKDVPLQPVLYARPERQIKLTSFPSVIKAGDTIGLKLLINPLQNIRSEIQLCLRGGNDYHDVWITFRTSAILPHPYYQGTQNMSGKGLQENLKRILSTGQQHFSYNKGRDLIFMEVDNQKNYDTTFIGNGLYSFYTQNLYKGYSSRKEAQNMGLNTEHIWPQSKFDKKFPMKSDLHHIYPVEITVNSHRSNYPFGTAKSVLWEKDSAILSKEHLFQPPKHARGAVARALFYMVLRYENFGNFLAGQEETLLEWHRQYPPTERERIRNELVYLHQGNRNPFVDYPQLIDRLLFLLPSKSKMVSVQSILWGKSANQFYPMEEPLFAKKPSNIRSTFKWEKKRILAYKWKDKDVSEFRIYQKDGRYLSHIVPTKKRKGRRVFFPEYPDQVLILALKKGKWIPFHVKVPKD